jgi:serine/threonine-protein kinase
MPAMAQHPPALAADELLLCRFDEAWQSGLPPRIADFLVGSIGRVRSHLLQELVRIDLEYRWRTSAGGTPLPENSLAPRPRLEHYVARFAELGALEQLSTDLIGDEYRVRCRWGDRPSLAEYQARFPGHASLSETLRHIDAELAAELSHTREALPDSAACAGLAKGAAPKPAELVQPVGSIPELLDVLRQGGFLTQEQLDELIRADVRGHWADVKALATELLERGWLTPYQINHLLQGKGRELLLGPYLLAERLGEGGAGQVFKARHRLMNRMVALKVIRKELLADAEAVARFYREIQIVSQLDHPNVVHAYDAGPAGASHFLAMELIEGIDLGKLVKQGGPLPVLQACAYVRQAALGLQHAHERGLVHRDIKPHNLIMSRREGLVKVADLGLARLPRALNEEVTAVLSGSKSTGPLTPDHAFMIGTADFLAPEQAMDFHKADIRADLYSLGCAFYFLLTGQPPFPSGTLASKIMRHLQTEPPAIEDSRADVPTKVSAIVRKLLAKQPEERYQTPADVVMVLDSVLGPEPATTLLLADGGPQGVSPRLWRKVRPSAGRWRRWAIALASLLAVGLGTVGFLVAWPGPAKQPRLPTIQVRRAPVSAPRLPPVAFGGGFRNARGLVLNGKASVGRGRLHLTVPGNWQAGSVFTSQKVGIGHFTTDFRFQLPAGLTTDGLTFTIQTAGTTVVGPVAGGLGYGPADPEGEPGIPRSVAVKFDSWDNHGEGDSSTGLYLNGASPTIPATNLAGTGIDLHTDHVFRVQMTYDSERLKVKLTDETTQASTSDNYRVDIPRVVGSFTAHVGFTASSGGTTGTPDILSWTYWGE